MNLTWMYAATTMYWHAIAYDKDRNEVFCDPCMRAVCGYWLVPGISRDTQPEKGMKTCVACRERVTRSIVEG